MPSISRRFTSFPRVAPTILPADEITSTTSGSGLFHSESDRMPTSVAVPTVAITGALVKISASGPIPTSRYWLQSPSATSTPLSRIASG